MAVYKRDYKPYEEGHTPGWSRFLVLPRYVFQDVFASRIITIFFIVSFMPFLGAMVLVYLRYNVKALEIFELPIQQLLAIDSTFFLYLLNAQCGFGLILTVLVGPGLVSMDLVNNALPMYFCRPFSRTEYVVGKMCVLAILLSTITWIPLTVLLGFQASLEGFGWLAENLRILFGVFLGAWVWILLMCFLSLAISAWVRWRPVAGAMLFGVFLVLAGFGEAVNQIVWDAFPKGLSGLQFVAGYLRLHGLGAGEAEDKAWQAIQQVGLRDAAHRKIAGYSKGMRQRIKLAQSISHHPAVMVLDEPLNGLDPMARAETIELFTSLAEQGLHVIISSHILHEVDMISDTVILLDNGYVVAEGDIRGVRSEVKEHPIQILIRCDRPTLIAAQVFGEDHVTEVKLHEDKAGLFVRTHDASQFYRLLNQVILENELNIETVAPADEDVQSVYDYLIGEGRSSP